MSFYNFWTPKKYILKQKGGDQDFTCGLFVRVEITHKVKSRLPSLWFSHVLFCQIFSSSSKVALTKLLEFFLYISTYFPYHSPINKHKFQILFQKVQLFWEGYKNVRNCPNGFEIYLANVETIRTIAHIFLAFSEKLNFKSSTCDLYTMTLEAGAGLTIRIWTAAASPA